MVTQMWLHESQDEHKIWSNLQELNDEMSYVFLEKLIYTASARYYLWTNLPITNCFCAHIFSPSSLRTSEQ